MTADQSATLVPAIIAQVWEQGISTRIALFRDWQWNGQKMSSIFLAGIQKSDGEPVSDSATSLCAFQINAVWHFFPTSP